MADKECTKCIHKEVCKTAESCDGFVSGCKHYREQAEGDLISRKALLDALTEIKEAPNISFTEQICDAINTGLGIAKGKTKKE